MIEHRKRVLLLVVDGCTPRVLKPAMDRGELPVLSHLAAAGSLALDCVSVFPSITPAATASIGTGQYPAQHAIAGMSWWNPSSRRITYYGDDVWTVFKRGAGEFLRSFLLRLNGDQLQAPTMFEVVERNGRRAACFNHLIFRGDVEHEVSQPLLLQLLPSVGSRLTVRGPSWLCLGDFVSSTGSRRDLDAPGGIFNRFGLDDRGTAGFLRDVPSAADLPDFTVAYFADYDFESHEVGPREALGALHRLDTLLGGVFDAWGGIERVLEETCVLMTADHSHSDVGAGNRSAIALEDLLSEYRRADPANGWKDGDELIVCPNMRAAEVYVRDERPQTIERVASTVLEDSRVDQVIWRLPREHGRDEFHIRTGDRGNLVARRAREEAAPRDDYGGQWELTGDTAALDLSIEEGRILYGAYPNALERISNGVDHPRTGRLWVTAHPGFEFKVTGQSVHHDAGSHGTLHALDSLVPLLITGAPRDSWLTTPPRIVDVAPLCARLLGIPFEPAPGASRG